MVPRQQGAHLSAGQPRPTKMPTKTSCWLSPQPCLSPETTLKSQARARHQWEIPGSSLPSCMANFAPRSSHWQRRENKTLCTVGLLCFAWSACCCSMCSRVSVSKSTKLLFCVPFHLIRISIIIFSLIF